jgi:hypothetical protein
MNKISAASLAIAAVLAATPVAFAQDSTNKGAPAATPDRGAGAMGAGAPAAGPRSNNGPADATPGRAAAPGGTVGAPPDTPNAPVPTNR